MVTPAVASALTACTDIGTRALPEGSAVAEHQPVPGDDGQGAPGARRRRSGQQRLGDGGGGRRADRQRVPRLLGDQVVGGLEGLRLLAGAGHAHGLAALGDDDGGDLGRVGLEGVGEVGRGAQARPQPVADQPGELEDGPQLGGGAQVALVGDALLVEGQDVRDRGPAVEEGDRRVVRSATRSALQGGSAAPDSAAAWWPGSCRGCRPGRRSG